MHFQLLCYYALRTVFKVTNHLKMGKETYLYTYINQNKCKFRYVVCGLYLVILNMVEIKYKIKIGLKCYF